MAANDSNLQLLISTVIFLNSVVSPQLALAQGRALPRANFNNHFGSGAQPGPAGGVSLQDGAYRAKNSGAQVYNPGEPKLGHKLVHWEGRFMPLKVWISPGKKLIEEPIQTINAQRPQEVYNMLNSDRNAIAGLQQCASWTPDMMQAAIQGIEQWREFQNEGLFSFQFVEDPTQANILLFWADRLTGDESAGGVSTGGNTVAILYDANQVHQAEAQHGKPVHGTPVIIEVVAIPEFEKLQARIAHEFGHALGIKEHSPYNDDLMCVNGIAKYVSASDKATIRWLYKQPPAYLMLPPRYSAAAMAQQAPEDSQAGQPSQPGPRGGGYKIRSGSSSTGSESSSGGAYENTQTQTQSQNSDSSGESDDTGSSGGRSGYKIRNSAPAETRTHYNADSSGESVSKSKHDKEDNSKDDKPEKKEKEKKKKHKDDVESLPSIPVEATPAPPAKKDRASDGF